MCSENLQVSITAQLCYFEKMQKYFLTLYQSGLQKWTWSTPYSQGLLNSREGKYLELQMYSKNAKFP